MSALENLTNSINKLTAATDAATAAITNPKGPTDDQINAAASAVDTQTARLMSALLPPTVAS